jgi:hypothetical protein
MSRGSGRRAPGLAPTLLAGLTAVLPLACSAAGAPERTLVFSGVSLTTRLEDGVAVVGEAMHRDGTKVPVGYAMLGRAGGRQELGGALPDGARLRLSIGIGSDLWITDASGSRRLESAELEGLSGARLDHGELELRGGKSQFDAIVPAGTSWEVDFVDGRAQLTEVRG